MVILDLLLVALIALGAFNGHKKALVGVVVGFASLILSIVLAFGFIKDAIEQNDPYNISAESPLL